MHASDKGIALIKRFEGCCLTAYKDRVGVWTIGWGTTNADKSITGRTLKRGMKISQETAAAGTRSPSRLWWSLCRIRCEKRSLFTASNDYQIMAIVPQIHH